MRGQDPHADLDNILDLLADEMRRQIILSLQEADQECIAVDDLISEDIDRERALIQLQHHRFTKLEESNVLRWNPESGQLRQGPQFEIVTSYLELIRGHTESSERDQQRDSQ